VPTNNGSRLVTVSIAGLVSLGALPGLAAAADADAPAADSSALEEVTVTASKLNATKVLDTPVSIQAISGDALQRSGASGIMDIAGAIPGLSIQDLGPGDKKYVIRGINSAGASTTGIYYGEAVISGSNADDGGGFESDIRLYDLDRVEVLRGPQGTLYGASSMSGTIRFIPKLPNLTTVEGYGTVEVSNTSHTPTNNYNFNGAFNLPLIEGMLSMRVVGWKQYDSGYINQTRVGTLGVLQGVNDDDVGGGRVELRYKPFDELTIDLNYTAQTETSDGSSRWTPPGVAAFAGDPIKPIDGCDLCNTDVTQSPWSDNLQVYGFTAAYDTHFGTVTATSNQFNRRTSFNFDSTPILIHFGVPIPGETLEPRNRRVNSSELRYASDFNFPVNFVVGGYR
jgi:outer membrane receptor protein involved in Fe transport